MEFQDILYEKYNDRAKITINRPDKMNMFTNRTLHEMITALESAWTDKEVGAVILTAAGNRAFTIGGTPGDAEADAQPIEKLPMPSLFAQLLHTIRSIPKPVVAAVNGYAIGGGHVIQVVCDLTIASSTAKFGQVGPKVGSFDAGYGSAYLARIVGEKKAREFWYLCKKYSADECLQMGLVNAVVPPEKLMEETDKWVDAIVKSSPTSLAALKMSFNADSASVWGIQSMAGVALGMYFNTDEAKECGKAFGEKRDPDIAKYR
ncbi:enoyl-CoA hydratase-related protein [Synergistes jonesii]|uniref:Dihydroxynaphthoic acid synthetase n=1 Tax=Synergistes jonesii TaxID=2754 RepID=A0A073IQ51_9BACT|nr:enoyl-CoA hydratase-related protein [Synergistes jonesii]KEJ91586.1 dihydroxynaphthoic acid synthetase [Synergistes jonesii]OFB60635.1 dihydroxynaphthoic acid synthetase [Synergistes jonesii]OFB61618.1 dihydroxynaphthoic acid synthetase [Synergistes jonesii]OFB64968.1 dihydroxynaphthoic acid synthetase [Synergistes jonesii]OFB66832.1 dihydroxynaphthoic acid synthetase [Synergistes jonesii]